ncbi:hypothetical protein V3C99_007874 [Haemonchus contortus]
MFLDFFPLFLLLASFTSTAADFKVRIGSAREACAKAGAPSAVTLALRKLWAVFYQKDSKIIIARRYGTPNYYQFKGAMEVKYNTTRKDLRIGIYILIVRISKLRENESPETNILLTSKTSWTKDRLSNAGVGVDFSEMYFESPFGPTVRVVELTKAGEVERGSYALSQCSDHMKWIANEGLYQLNLKNGKWYPVYFNPDESDFYYEYN